MLNLRGWQLQQPLENAMLCVPGGQLQHRGQQRLYPLPERVLLPGKRVSLHYLHQWDIF